MPKSHVKNHLEMKRANRSEILNLLLKNKTLSRKKLADLMGVTKPTITNIINELLDVGFVKEGDIYEPEEQRTGRKQRLLEINSHTKLTFAVNMGVPDCAIGLVDLLGNIIASEPLSLDLVQNTSKENLERIITQSCQFLKSQNVLVEELLGIGVVTPDDLWDKEMIRRIFHESFSTSVISGSNIQAMALGEYIFNLDHPVESLALIYVGRRIGLGLVLNGKLWDGARHFAGSLLGHLPVVSPYLMNSKNYVEDVAAQPAIAAKVCQLYSRKKQVQDDYELIDFLVESALKGDTKAIHLLEATGENLYISVLAVLSVLDPERIIIAGRLAKAKDYILPPIQKRLDLLPQSGNYPVPKIQASEEINLGLKGAATLILKDQFYSSNLILPNDKK